MANPIVVATKDSAASQPLVYPFVTLQPLPLQFTDGSGNDIGSIISSILHITNGTGSMYATCMVWQLQDTRMI